MSRYYVVKISKLAGIFPSSKEFIFRQVTFLKKTNSYILRKGDKPLSYTRARKVILSGLESIGLDQSKFGIHSLCSGGATASAAAGINDRIFKKHGRWRSEKAKDGNLRRAYKKNYVSTNLGI